MKMTVIQTVDNRHQTLDLERKINGQRLQKIKAGAWEREKKSDV